MKFEKAFAIYVSGYRTGCGFTIMEYLEAASLIRDKYRGDYEMKMKMIGGAK